MTSFASVPLSTLPVPIIFARKITVLGLLSSQMNLPPLILLEVIAQLHMTPSLSASAPVRSASLVSLLSVCRGQVNAH